MKIKENGELEGRVLLHFLATRPATAQFISRKLALRFVSDDPAQSLIDRMAKSYLASGGDIAVVLTTLFHSPEFWAISAYRAKVKTPIEFVVSAVRSSHAKVNDFQALDNAVSEMGMPVYGSMPPTGYNWQASTWISTGALVNRMNFAMALTAGKLPGIAVNWVPQQDTGTIAASPDSSAQSSVPSIESEESRLETLLVAGGVSISTRSAVLQQDALSTPQNLAAAQSIAVRKPASLNNINKQIDLWNKQDQQIAGLLLGSPEFQRR
jgi:uncharacterized protein (DUF1800 family)